MNLSSPSSCLQPACSLSQCITVIISKCAKLKQQHSQQQYGHASRHNAYLANINRVIERWQNRWRMRVREWSDAHDWLWGTCVTVQTHTLSYSNCSVLSVCVHEYVDMLWPKFIVSLQISPANCPAWCKWHEVKGYRANSFQFLITIKTETLRSDIHLVAYKNQR